jgi:hypothetical protein
MSFLESVQHGIEKASQEASRLAKIQHLHNVITDLSMKSTQQSYELAAQAMELFHSGKLTQSELTPLCQQIATYQQQIAEVQDEIKRLQAEAHQPHAEQPSMPDTATPPPPGYPPYPTPPSSYPPYPYPASTAATPLPPYPAPHPYAYPPYPGVPEPAPAAPVEATPPPAPPAS